MVDQYSSQTGDPFPGNTLTEQTLYSLEQYGGLVDHLLERNIHVIIALNTYSWRAGKSWPDDGRTVWSNAPAQQEVVDMWAAFATRLRGRPGVIFDLFNEPHGTTPAESANDHALAVAAWNSLHQRIALKVGEVDPDRWMMVEPIWGETKYLNHLALSSSKKVIYQIHSYNPHSFTFQGGTGDGWPAAGSIPYPGVVKDLDHTPALLWDRAALLAELATARQWAQSRNVRIALGEAGVTRSAPVEDRARYVVDAISVAEELQLGLIWFAYDGWGVPLTFRLGWSYENSEAEQPLKTHFLLNSDPARRLPQ